MEKPAVSVFMPAYYCGALNAWLEKDMGTDGDGYSDLRDSELKIVINSETDYLPRKRFTIAHELGHVFIGWHDDVTLCKTDNEFVEHNMLDIQEKETNIFASELLMPTNWVKEQLKKMNKYQLDTIIQKLSSTAQTSLMASFYALENAFDSGNVMIIYPDNIEWGKRFVAVNTCGSHLLGMDFKDTCEILSRSNNIYKIGSYKVYHYIFEPCPDKNLVLKTYNMLNDLILTLESLSNHSIINLLHCAKNILNVIDDSYILLLYRGNELLLIEYSSSAELLLPYRCSRETIVQICVCYEYEYKVKELNRNMALLVVREPVYKDVKAWMSSETDSKILCNQILNDLYYGDTINKKRMSISGIIGGANSTHKGVTLEKLYDVIQKKMRRIELYEFVQHRYFNDFVSLKCFELLRRR